MHTHTNTHTHTHTHTLSLSHSLPLSHTHRQVPKTIDNDVAFIDKIPLGATGKINKLSLRETFKNHKLPTAQAAE